MSRGINWSRCDGRGGADTTRFAAPSLLSDRLRTYRWSLASWSPTGILLRPSSRISANGVSPSAFAKRKRTHKSVRLSTTMPKHHPIRRVSSSKARVQIRGCERIEMRQGRTTWRLEDELQAELEDAGTMCRIGMKESTRSKTGGICGRIQRTAVTSHSTVYARPLRMVENIKRLRAKLE